MARRSRIESYRDLDVWRRGLDLVEQVYSLTRSFPGDERFGLTGQIRRAAVSIPSNIAEGWGRRTRRYYVRFLRIARGSLAELETQAFIAHRLGYLSEEVRDILLQETDIESRMLLNLIRALTP